MPALSLSLSMGIFQSTLPLRGATVAFGAFDVAEQFQSTLPLRGATFQTVLMMVAVV